MISHDVLILLLFAMTVALGYQRWSAAERRREDAEAANAWCEAERAAHQHTCDRANHLRTELLAAQGALEDFGTHEDGCEWRPHMDAELDCTCGLVDAKERARKAVVL